MQFCDGCDNLLSLRRRGNELEWYCTSCEYSIAVRDGAAVTTRMTRKQSGSDAVNALMVHDPRLPRSRDLPCPNAECRAPPLCVSVRTDAERMIFTHICVHCQHIWTPAPGRAIDEEEEEEEEEDVAAMDVAVKAEEEEEEGGEGAKEVSEEDLAFWEDTVGSSA